MLERDDSESVLGCQKIALYEVEGEFQHALAQIPDGRWPSKMGQGPVIQHRNPESLAGGMYGNPTVLMRRATVATDHH